MSLTDVFHASTRAQALSQLSSADQVLAAVITIEEGKQPHMHLDKIAAELAEIIVAAASPLVASRIIDLAAANGFPWHVVQQYQERIYGGYRSLHDAFEVLADDKVFTAMAAAAGTWSIVRRRHSRDRFYPEHITTALPYISSVSIVEEALRLGSFDVTAAALLRLVELAPADHVAEIMDSGLLISDKGFVAAAKKLPVEYQLRWAFQPNRSFIHRDHLQQGFSTEMLIEHLPRVEPHVRTGIEQVLAKRAEQS